MCLCQKALQICLRPTHRSDFLHDDSSDISVFWSAGHRLLSSSSTCHPGSAPLQKPAHVHEQPDWVCGSPKFTYSSQHPVCRDHRTNRLRAGLNGHRERLAVRSSCTKGKRGGWGFSCLPSANGNNRLSPAGGGATTGGEAERCGPWALVCRRACDHLQYSSSSKQKVRARCPRTT